MELRTKKIIAREFLVTLTCLLVSFLFFIGTIIYNYRLESQRTDILNEIEIKTQLTDSLTRPYKEKLDNQEWFYTEAKNKEAQGDYENSQQLWTRLTSLSKADSVIYKWDNVWSKELKEVLREIGFKDGKAFNSFIGKNILSDEESKSFDRIRTLKEEINTLNEKSKNLDYKQFDKDNQIESSLAILLIIGIIGFPIRYFIYAIRWSYRVLKQKE